MIKLKTKRIEETIGRNFAIAMINNDTSGFSDEDILNLDSFEEVNQIIHCYMPDDCGTKFTRCSVSGLLDDCVIVALEVKL